MNNLNLFKENTYNNIKNNNENLTNLYGSVIKVSDGCINIKNLSNASMGEKLIITKNGAIAMVMSFGKDKIVNAILLTKSDEIEEGNIVIKTSELLSIEIKNLSFIGNFTKPI